MTQSGKPRIIPPEPMVDPLHGFAFFTNAKCGGTTLKHWFLSSPRFHRMIRSRLASARHFRTRVFTKDYKRARGASWGYERNPTDHVARAFIHHYRRLLTGLDAPPLYPGMPRFLVVRDPYARAVSAFVDKFCGEDRNLPWVRKVVDADSPTFIDFLRYVERTPASETNGHWRRQSFIIDGMPDITLLRLETLQEDIERHAAVWGDRDPGILVRKTQFNTYETALEPGSAAQMTADALVAFRERAGSFPSKDAFLSPEVRNLVRSAYSKDFERFRDIYS